MGEGGFIKVTETKATTKEENERIVTSRRTRRRERESFKKKKAMTYKFPTSIMDFSGLCADYC